MNLLRKWLFAVVALLAVLHSISAFSADISPPQRWFYSYQEGWTTDGNHACELSVARNAPGGYGTVPLTVKYVGYKVDVDGTYLCSYAYYTADGQLAGGPCELGYPNGCGPVGVPQFVGCMKNPAVYDGAIDVNVDPTTGQCWTPGYQKQFKDFGKTCDKSLAEGKTTCGNPINPANGNKFEQATDYIGNGPFPLTFQRYYNSRLSSGPFLDNSRWRHTYMRSLRIASDLGSVKVVRPDGSELYYTSTGDGVNYVHSTSSGITPEKLTKIATGWRYLNRQDESEDYNNTGRLQTITNRNGLVQTLIWDTNGKLAQVTDPASRTLTFTYDTQGRLLTLKDPANGLYQYGYDANSNLSTVTYPDTKIRQYRYEKTDAVLLHTLTGIVDENNARFASFDYVPYLVDQSGGYSTVYTDAYAVSSEHAGGVEKVTLTPYDQVNRTVTVTDAFGTQRIYGFSAYNTFDTLLTSVSGPACNGCGLAAVTA